MPAINIADIQIPVQMVQNTTPSLKIMDSSGVVYYADAMMGACPNAVKIYDSENTYSIGAQTLVYESDSFDVCETVTLVPGCYYVEVRGGRGGDGGNNAGSGANATIQSYNFVINQQTDVFVFRGADGNAGGVNIDGDVATGGGGGASGAPSLFAIGNDVIVSDGGAGGRGASGIDANGNAQNCGAGGGGNAGDLSNGLGAYADSGLTNSFFICGAGGGGAPNGVGGARANSGLYYGDVGGDADINNGGGGGEAHRLLSSHSGGAGGATVSFSCAGQNLYSYGGGGGGAVESKTINSSNMDGGAGGSGTTGTSDVSFVRIYRFG